MKSPSIAVASRVLRVTQTAQGTSGTLKPRHQLGIDPCGKVTNRSLVGSAPSLKRQDERVDGSYGSQDEETQRNDPKRSAEDA